MCLSLHSASLLVTELIGFFKCVIKEKGEGEHGV